MSPQPESFLLLPDVLSTDEECFLLLFARAALDEKSFSVDGRKRVRRFGYDYTLVERWLGSIPPALEPPSAIAEYGPFDSLTVAEYRTGDILSPHVDRAEFGDAIAVVSLGAASVLTFTRGAQRLEERIPPRSAYVMRGELRSSWTHATRSEGDRASLVYRSRVRTER